MIIQRRKSFDKSFKKTPQKIALKSLSILKIFEHTPLDPELRNHALKGKRLGCRSLDVTGDWRIVFKELSNRTYELVELIELGTRSQLYG